MKVLSYEPKHILTIAGRCVADCPACLLVAVERSGGKP